MVTIGKGIVMAVEVGFSSDNNKVWLQKELNRKSLKVD